MWDDICNFGGVQECTMDPLIGLDLLAQNRDVVVRGYQGIEGIHSVPWISAGVRAYAGEFAEELLSGVHICTRDTVRNYTGEELVDTCVAAPVSLSLAVGLTKTYPIKEMSTSL